MKRTSLWGVKARISALGMAVGVALLLIGCSAPALLTVRRGVSVATPADAGRADLLPARESAGIAAEELWIIQRPTSPKDKDSEAPGCGGLVATAPGTQRKVAVPLKHTDVQAIISGYIATVGVKQQFHNPYDSKIEAVYVFPLPANAAVSEFLMTIGERRIRGIVREREEARRLYDEAKRQGYVASLLTEERPNIFTQAVANIEPGKQIDIDIKYFHTLAYVDGSYEFVFPMVVGPRFNPPGSSGGVGAIPRGSHGASGQKTEVQYLAPGERSGHDISLSVAIDAGVDIEKVECRTHKIALNSTGAGRADVKLDEPGSIPNRDFVLRYKVAGRYTKSALLTHRDERGGYFTLMLVPPEGLSELPRGPMEMVFVLDCSGSMSGEPLAQAKAAIAQALRKMRPEDSFQIIRFSTNASSLGRAPIPATAANVQRGLQYLWSLDSEGGTMMIEGIRAALQFPHDSERLRFVAFLTDGFIGNESEILGEMHKYLGASRVFSFGVGTSTNRFLLDHMAKMGRGAVAYLDLKDDAASVMDRYFERVSHAALSDIVIDGGGMQVSEVYPARVPDLFVGRPVVVTGRYEGGRGVNEIKIRGRAGGQAKELAVRVDLDDGAVRHASIPAVWARAKIAELAERAIYSDAAESAMQIREVALGYGLVSAYTAFVAVDSMTRTAGDHGTTVAVPVPVPAGVRYETTVPAQDGGG